MSGRRAGVGLLLVLASAVAVPAWADVTIESIGLEGHITARPGVVPVRVRVTNPAAQAQTLEVTLRLARAEGAVVGEEGSFATEVALGPGERRALDLPMLSVGMPGHRVEVTARADGAVIGAAQRTIGSEQFVANQLVALLCDDDAACREAQSRVSFAGTDEDRVAKRRALTFVVVREPPTVWWQWGPAWTVVVARRLRDFDAEARAALEGFARHGGRIVLVEDRLADAAFLAPYRRGEPGRPQPIGEGRVARVPSLADAGLDALFTAGVVAGQHRGSGPYDGSEASWVTGRLARAPLFPGLGSLALALTAYVIVVGVVNFAVLRRLGRPEWAWLTVPALAVLFAAAFYVVATQHRPRAFHVDEIALRWMDDRSDVAAVQETLRLSSAGRAAVRLGVPGEAVLTGPRALPTIVQMAALGPQITSTAWSVRVGPTLAIDVALAPWSFRDVSVRATRRAAGTVRLDEALLRNETGETFADALFIEPGWVYRLGTLPAGAAVDLSRARREPLAQFTGQGWPFPHGLSVEAGGTTRWPTDPPPGDAFGLPELLRGWPTDGGRAFEARRGIFLGYGAGGALNGNVTGVSGTRTTHVVTVVSLGRR